MSKEHEIRERYNIRTYEEGLRDGYQKGSWDVQQSMMDLIENPPLPQPHYIMVHCCDNPASCTKQDKFMHRVKEMVPNARIEDKKSLWRRVKSWFKR